MGTKRTPASPAEKRAQLALKASWEKKKEIEGLTQADAAEHCGFSPANFSHYINGRNPLNYKTLVIFCDYLNEDPMEVWPEAIIHSTPEAIVRDEKKARKFAEKTLSKMALAAARKIDTLGSARKTELVKFIDKFVDGYVAIDQVKATKKQGARNGARRRNKQAREPVKS